ncbi:MAG: hypothetical protein H7Z42_11265 [Roseiflexaceae bacterium]|nr:hypothetical protein [Roseiflexaceae bacterium]
MCTIVCFTDSGTVTSAVQATLGDHDLHMLSASRLSADVRDVVQRLAPDVVLLELSRAMDNAHIFFFLRSDQTTRETPIVLVSANESSTHQARVLEADAVLTNASLPDKLRHTIARFQPHEHSVAA